jgi:hypothetical protein
MNVVATVRCKDAAKIMCKDMQNTILLDVVQTFPLGRFVLVRNWGEKSNYAN